MPASCSTWMENHQHHRVNIIIIITNSLPVIIIYAPAIECCCWWQSKYMMAFSHDFLYEIAFWQCRRVFPLKPISSFRWYVSHVSMHLRSGILHYFIGAERRRWSGCRWGGGQCGGARRFHGRLFQRSGGDSRDDRQDPDECRGGEKEAQRYSVRPTVRWKYVWDDERAFGSDNINE